MPLPLDLCGERGEPFIGVRRPLERGVGVARDRDDDEATEEEDTVTIARYQGNERQWCVDKYIKCWNVGALKIGK